MMFKEKTIEPRIPKGFKYLEGTPADGFVIKSERGNEFVWVPVQALLPNGTDNNGRSFDAKFGRRKFNLDVNLSWNEFWEDETRKYKQQKELVEKCGGFYISRYSISEGCVSIPGRVPITDIDQYDARYAAYNVEDRAADVSSRLMYGSEYDCMLEWLIESGSKELREINQWSQTSWGNLFTRESVRVGICRSDANPAWEANKLYDVNGNVSTWTLEKYKDTPCGVIRGTGWRGSMSVAYRGYSYPQLAYDQCGYRVVLHWTC